MNQGTFRRLFNLVTVRGAKIQAQGDPDGCYGIALPTHKGNEAVFCIDSIGPTWTAYFYQYHDGEKAPSPPLVVPSRIPASCDDVDRLHLWIAGTFAGLE